MKTAFLMALTLFACGVPAPHAAAPGRVEGHAVWATLQARLPGVWMLDDPAHRSISFHLIANGSAIVERWGEDTPRATETVFYRDHDDVLLTHFCGQGNEPRLRADEASADSVVFRFVDVTNREPGQDVLVERRLRFTGGALEDAETYRTAKGADETTVFRFVRP